MGYECGISIVPKMNPFISFKRVMAIADYIKWENSLWAKKRNLSFEDYAGMAAEYFEENGNITPEEKEFYSLRANEDFDIWEDVCYAGWDGKKMAGIFKKILADSQEDEETYLINEVPYRTLLNKMEELCEEEIYSVHCAYTEKWGDEGELIERTMRPIQGLELIDSEGKSIFKDIEDAEFTVKDEEESMEKYIARTFYEALLQFKYMDFHNYFVWFWESY